jgi:nicotinate-nucleotide adenylyltransferase
VGHLLLAQEARWQLGLDEVLLMVTGQAPHKKIEDDPGAGVRLEMARLAADGEDGVEASDLEVGRDEVSYSYRTLELLAEENGGRELWFLLGADMAAGLSRWKEPERVVELARLGVVPRPGVGIEEVNAAVEGLGASGRAEIIDMPLCGASSTTVRQRAREGKPLRHLVPDGVVGLIESRGLYR